MDVESILDGIHVKLNTEYHDYGRLNLTHNLPNFGEGLAYKTITTVFGIRSMRISCDGIGNWYSYPIKVLSPI